MVKYQMPLKFTEWKWMKRNHRHIEMAADPRSNGGNARAAVWQRRKRAVGSPCLSARKWLVENFYMWMFSTFQPITFEQKEREILPLSSFSVTQGFAFAFPPSLDQQPTAVHFLYVDGEIKPSGSLWRVKLY